MHLFLFIGLAALTIFCFFLVLTLWYAFIWGWLGIGFGITIVLVFDVIAKQIITLFWIICHLILCLFKAATNGGKSRLFNIRGLFFIGHRILLIVDLWFTCMLWGAFTRIVLSYILSVHFYWLLFAWATLRRRVALIRILSYNFFLLIHLSYNFKFKI